MAHAVTPILRPDQQQLTIQLRASIASGKRAPLLVAPTAWGKTFWFSSVAQSAIAKQKRVIILSHRTELIDQISESLNLFNVPHSYISAGYGYDPFAKVHIASVFTLAKRIGKIAKPDLFIIDEAHHSIRKSTWGKILDFYPGTPRIGVTATPFRMSGEGLGDLFDDLIVGPSVRELIDNGTLSNYRMFAPTTLNLSTIHTRIGEFVQSELSAAVDVPSIIGDAVTHYRKYAEGKQAVAFCVSVEHAHHTRDAFRQAGFNAECIDGTMERLERRRVVEAFRCDRLKIITSCNIVNEGFDVKGIECGIFLRPTQSLTLWLQQLGRCLRSKPGKTYAILLDHANNAMRHGLPDSPREWSLEGHIGKVAKKQLNPVRMCPKCYFVQPAAGRVCRNCRFAFEGQPREVQQESGELQEIDMAAAQRLLTARDSKTQDRFEQGRAQTLEELRLIEKRKGYRRGWAEHIIEARQRKGTARRFGEEDTGDSMPRNAYQKRESSNLFSMAAANRPKGK